jgi:ketosteroid isomerase-like protein
MFRSRLCLALAAATSLSALPVAAADDPIAVVRAAYVDGVHRNADAAAFRAGFHDSFVMYVNGPDGVTTVTREDWAARLEKAAANPDRKTPNIEADLEIVGESGDAAVVRVELRRDGKHLFTDFLSLYRTADGWKIVTKIYQRHP